MAQLQSKDSNLLQQKTLLSGLQTSVANFAASLTSLGKIGSTRALSASSSDATIVSAAATGAATAASYTIDSIVSIATAASERSTVGYADSASTQVSATGQVTLQVGSTTKTLTLTNNNLTGLRDQINGSGLGVTASILTTSDGNYLTVSANTTGATTLKLFDGPDTSGTNLLTNTNQGSDADFQLNGIHVHQAGNVVNSVIPGVTFTILGKSSGPVTISVASDRTKLSGALQDFVANYNALKQQVGAQVGPSAGLLSGDTVINQLQDLLRQITSFRGANGTVQSLSDLGVEFSNTGVASFNPDTFNSLTDQQVTDGFSYVSSVGSYAANLQSFSDPITGFIKVEMDGIDRSDRTMQTQISTLNDRIAVMQSNLTLQLEKADAAQAALESQQSALTASLQGLSLVLYGKNAQQLG